MAKSRLLEWKYQILHTPLVLKVSQWYQSLPEREQKLVYWLGLILVLSLLYALLWVPAETSRQKAEKSLKRELTLHQWMQNNRHRVQGASHVSGSAGGSLLSVINESARQHKVTLARFEPDGEKGVRIWLEKAVFDDVMAWTQQLETRGIVVSQLNADRDVQGRASFRITFRR